ncbi:MAG: hypothetical protein AAGC95_01800 [Pseudomonadota bacterium]
MSKSYAPKGSVRSSYPHQDERLRVQNPLYQKTEPITRNFETNRCDLHAKVLEQEGMSEAERRRANMKDVKSKKARRESFMVKRSQPRHLMRPPRMLSYGPDHAAFAHYAEQDHFEAVKSMEKPVDARSAVKAFRAARKKEFVARRLREEGFDLDRANTHKHSKSR